MQLSDNYHPPLSKRLIGGFFDYGIPLLMITSGAFVLGFVSDVFGLIAGIMTQISGLIVFTGSQLGINRKFTGLTLGKEMAKLRYVEISNTKPITTKPIEKGEQSKKVIRFIVAFIGLSFFPLYFTINVILIVTDHYNRSISDFLSETIVINFDSKEETKKQRD
jgi:hypothetical protein